MSAPETTTATSTSPRSRVSKRIGVIAESATLAVDAKAKALKAAGRPDGRDLRAPGVRRSWRQADQLTAGQFGPTSTAGTGGTT